MTPPSHTCPACATPLPKAAAFCPRCGAATPTDELANPETAGHEQLRAAVAERYRLDRQIGHGGNAVVYLAHDLRHDRPVALKVLQPELALPVRASRFLREIQIAAKLSHPQILPVLDSGEGDGFLYYVMPYVEGESLRERLQRDKQLPIVDALQIAREVADALAYAHGRDVVHRDIKPENILLQAGHAVVADFGIARALTAASGQTVTEAGVAVGTPAYMSPEQGSGEQYVDGRSDLYSLACVLFEMLAGEPPFTGPHARAIFARQLTEHPRSVRALRPDTPPAVEQAIARALAKDPEDRFPTVARFIDALEAGDAAKPQAAMLGTTRTLAVLPFVNMSPDPETDYFSDGITEELINALTKVAGLRVASRTSVFALKNKPQDVRAIGALLGVSAVLEGSVRKAGDQLRITARLMAADDGRHLWSERYDRRLDDVFAIQDEIARIIVSTLRTTFLAEVADPTPRRYTENLVAYGLYLRGRPNGTASSSPHSDTWTRRSWKVTPRWSSTRPPSRSAVPSAGSTTMPGATTRPASISGGRSPTTPPPRKHTGSWGSPSPSREPTTRQSERCARR